MGRSAVVLFVCFRWLFVCLFAINLSGVISHSFENHCDEMQCPVFEFGTEPAIIEDSTVY